MKDASAVIDLMNGEPPEDLLPNDIIEQACSDLFTKKFTNGESVPLDYGNDTRYFGEKLANFLVKYDSRTEVNSARIVPTAGISSGLDLLTTYFLKLNDHKKSFVFVEDTTYFMSMAIFRDHGLEIVSVPTDHTGIVLSAFEKLLEKYCSPGVGSGIENDRTALFLYAIPSFNNPTGRCTSEENRIALLELTRRFNLPVVSDEVYQLLNFTKEIRAYISEKEAHNQLHRVLSESDAHSDVTSVPRTMSSFGFDHVFSLGSFAKILAPGLRVGWVELPTDAHTAAFLDLGIFISGGNIAHFNSCIVAACMEPRDSEEEHCPLWNHINWLRRVYAAKWYALVNSICKHSAEMLPQGEENQLSIEGVHCSPNVLTGGYFIWIRFPEWCGSGSGTDGAGLSHDEFLDLAMKKFQVSFRLGRDCIVPGSVRTDNCMYARLCFARRTEAELEEGAERLCRFVQYVYNNNVAKL